jgi:hypothetical protein
MNTGIINVVRLKLLSGNSNGNFICIFISTCYKCIYKNLKNDKKSEKGQNGDKS